MIYDKIKKFNNTNNNILNTIILVIFIILSVFLGLYHEPWADEAQAWLIARDASVFDIIFKLARYEGSPMLWQLLLKALILLKFPYKFYFLIPIFFVSIGLYIILFKLEIKNIYKILLPFTYFIAFEYGIKARNYCLLVPIMAMIAMLWKDRKEKVYLYNLFLLLLSCVSLHGAIISGMLFCVEIIELLSDYKNNRIDKLFYEKIISVVILTLFYGFLMLVLKPTDDVFVYISASNLAILPFYKIVLYFIVRVAEAFCLRVEDKFVIALIELIISYLLFIPLLKSNKQKWLFISVFFAITFFMLTIRLTEHHVGLTFFCFIFLAYLIKDSMPEKNKKVFSVLFTIVLCVQVVWYVDSYIAEVKTEFSAAKSTAEYIKTLDYENKTIYSSGYYTVAILPYFENNIFSGEREDNSYYVWGYHNFDWRVICWKEEALKINILEKKPDIIVLDDRTQNESAAEYATFINEMLQNKEYTCKYFEANMIYKTSKGDRETEGFYVFEKVK